MYLSAIVPLFVLLGASLALDISSLIPATRRCGVKYREVLKEADWVCEESQFQKYPKMKVDAVLARNGTVYDNMNYFLDTVRTCQTYQDKSQVYGENAYYTYESICKMVRKPVRVVWALVPDYVVPADLMTLRGGLLPVSVLDGQELFDVKCIHPWADGIPKHFSKRLQRRLSRIRFTGVKRNLCMAGYAYNYNMVCKPTGFIEREVLVYSEHANKIFSLIIPDVPTSCKCAYCRCKRPTRRRRPGILGRPGRPGPAVV